MQGAQKSTKIKPFDGDYRFTSKWGWRVIFGFPNWHTGLDWAMPIGTPLYAVMDGRVISTRTESQWQGKYIDIEYAGFTLRYLHVDSFLVSEGQLVKAGQEVAKSGNTGLSSGPHLHLENMRNVNPAFIGIDPNTGVFDSTWKNKSDIVDVMQDELLRELLLNNDFHKFPASTRAKLIDAAKRGDAKFILQWSGSQPRKDYVPYWRAFERLKKHKIWNRLDKLARQRINQKNIISIHTRFEAEQERNGKL